MAPGPPPPPRLARRPVEKAVALGGARLLHQRDDAARVERPDAEVHEDADRRPDADRRASRDDLHPAEPEHLPAAESVACTREDRGTATENDAMMVGIRALAGRRGRERERLRGPEPAIERRAPGSRQAKHRPR